MGDKESAHTGGGEEDNVLNNGLLDLYGSIVGEDEVNEIRHLASFLKSAVIQHINSTKIGGGVAEILNRLVPLFNEVGIEATWDTIEGTQDYFDVTKAFHNALHGQDVDLTPEMFELYDEVCRNNYPVINNEADFIVLHDPQPLGLVHARKRNRGKWIWRCHIDLSEADINLWGRLRRLVEQVDASVFHLPEYSRGLYVDQYIIPPAIDPISDKNKELSEDEINAILSRFAIDRSRPYVIQVSRFDRLKDPVGVIEAFRIIRRSYDCQLVLAGGSASDDPEGAQVLKEVMEKSNGDPDIIVLDLPPTSHVEINALQRGAAVIIQKSIREGFGLVVTEAMWKGRPVVGSAVGGIRSQIMHGQTGMLSHSVEGCAFRVRQILANPELGERLGHQGKEYVRSNFLLPGLLKKWVLLMLATRFPQRGVIFLHDVIRKRKKSGGAAAKQSGTGKGEGKGAKNKAEA